MKRPTREFLEKRRRVVIADLQSKVEAEDWHGVADAAMDLREIDAQLSLIGFSPELLSMDMRSCGIITVSKDDGQLLTATTEAE